jgi:hypothetical protein
MEEDSLHSWLARKSAEIKQLLDPSPAEQPTCDILYIDVTEVMPAKSAHVKPPFFIRGGEIQLAA